MPTSTKSTKTVKVRIDPKLAALETLVQSLYDEYEDELSESGSLDSARYYFVDAKKPTFDAAKKKFIAGVNAAIKSRIFSKKSVSDYFLAVYNNTKNASQIRSTALRAAEWFK